ncbi:MAG: hypothetical protein ACOY0R_08185 [Chloroflexota bacterium]
MLRKIAAYNILPLFFIIAAFSLINRYQPEFSWELSVLSFDDDPNLYLFTPTAKTGLNEEPHMSVFQKNGYRCIAAGEVTYMHNELLTRKSAIEKNVEAANLFLAVILFTVILDFLVLIVSLLIINRISLLNTFIFSCLLGIVVIWVLMLLGPITTLHFVCMVELTVQAELTNISEVGSQYFLASIILAIITFLLIAFRYILFRDILFTLPPKNTASQ